MSGQQRCNYCGTEQDANRRKCRKCSNCLIKNEGERLIEQVPLKVNEYDYSVSSPESRPETVERRSDFTTKDIADAWRLGYMRMLLPVCILLCLTGGGMIIGLPLGLYFYFQLKAAPKEIVSLGTQLAGGTILRMVAVIVGILVVLVGIAAALALSHPHYGAYR